MSHEEEEGDVEEEKKDSEEEKEDGDNSEGKAHNWLEMILLPFAESTSPAATGKISPSTSKGQYT